MKILIKGGRVIDPANRIDETTDILIENSKISKVAKSIRNSPDKTIDATGKIVMPGLVDMHVHLREPGREDKETVKSGTLAAIKGGVTSILAMPNTDPTMDSVESVRLLKDIIDSSAQANVFICGAITRERKGEELNDIARLKREGIIAISDDGNSVDSDKIMLEALKRAKSSGVTLIVHAEDRSLSNAGIVNAGFTATRLGLRGVSKESEYKRVERDIALAEKSKTSVHFTHVSCKESLEAITKAKKSGLKVTCDVTPHHFTLDESALLDYDTNMKMNPPLRTKEDIAAIKSGLKNGLIDVIASDHAPHTENEKEIEFDRAEFGVVGLETELAVTITELVETGLLSWNRLVEKMCLNPAKILGVSKGTLTPGSDADIIVIDPDKEWVVEKAGFVSKSKNSCFLARKLKGIVEYTFCCGKLAYTVGE
jgi:dihydroorotase